MCSGYRTRRSAWMFSLTKHWTKLVIEQIAFVWYFNITIPSKYLLERWLLLFHVHKVHISSTWIVSSSDHNTLQRQYFLPNCDCNTTATMAEDYWRTPPLLRDAVAKKYTWYGYLQPRMFFQYIDMSLFHQKTRLYKRKFYDGGLRF